MEPKAGEGPDRGWSWVIAFAACFCWMIFSGVSRSSGIIFVALIKEYGVTREQASWPAVVTSAVLGLTGCVSGFLVQRFEIRPILFTGSIIGAAGLSACFFTTSLTSISICYGLIFGIGMGMTSPLMSIAINQYFKKYRATANGIAQSGACLGSFVFPVLFEFLMKKYGLNGCLLITGGIFLHMTIASAVVRPVSWLNKPNSVISASSNTARDVAYAHPSDESLEFERLIAVHAVNCLDVDESDASVHPFSEGSEAVEMAIAVRAVNCLDAAENVASVHPSTECSEAVQREIAVHAVNRLDAPETDMDPIKAKSSFSGGLKTAAGDIANSCNEFKRTEESSNDLEVVKASNSGECVDVPSDSLNKTCQSGTFILKRFKKHEANSVKSMRGIWRAFKKIATCAMLYVAITNTMTFYTLYTVFFIIIIDHSLDKGVPEEQSKYILYGFAVTDLFGRLCFGWVTDRKFLTRQRYIMLNMILVGLTFCCFPFASSIGFLVTVSGFYGLFFGCTAVMFSVVIADFVGIDVISIAIGYNCLFLGILSLVRPFLIGFFRDNLGSYSSIFYLLGAVSVATSLLWLLEPCFVKKPPKTKEQDLKNI